jgi:hypothetical protein
MFIDEIRSLIEAADVATGGTNFFNSLLSAIPKGAGPYLLIRETGGLSPDKIHNQTVPPAYVRPQAQLMAVSTDPDLAYRMIQDAYVAVVGKRNQLIGASSRTVALTRAGSVVTGETEEPHRWGSGYQIVIAGADQSVYNGTHTITVTGETSFTYIVVGTPATPATGTLTAAYLGTWYRSIDAIQDPFNLSLDSDDRARYAFNIRADKVFS